MQTSASPGLAGSPTLTGPLAVGAAALGACALLAVRDPNQTGSYGLCPFKAVTGLDCPGCGLLRGTAALLHGDPIRALDHNVFLPVVLVVLAVAYGRWLWSALGRHLAPRPLPLSAVWVASAAVMLFWVARLVAGPGSWLASGAT